MSRRIPVRLGLVAAVAALIATTGGLIAATFSSFQDQARLNLAASGIGLANRFDIAVVVADGTVEQADASGGYSWKVRGAESLVPGRSVVTKIPVFNNTPNLAADTTMRLLLLNGDGSVGTAPNITKFLRFTATTGDGTVVFRDVTWDKAQGDVGVLDARGQDALTQGQQYVPGRAGSAETITMTITYLDAAETKDYNGGLSALAVRFDASSVRP